MREKKGHCGSSHLCDTSRSIIESFEVELSMDILKSSAQALLVRVWFGWLVIS